MYQFLNPFFTIKEPRVWRVPFQVLIVKLHLKCHIIDGESTHWPSSFSSLENDPTLTQIYDVLNQRLRCIYTFISGSYNFLGLNPRLPLCVHACASVSTVCTLTVWYMGMSTHTEAKARRHVSSYVSLSCSLPSQSLSLSKPFPLGLSWPVNKLSASVCRPFPTLKLQEHVGVLSFLYGCWELDQILRIAE